MALIKAYSSVRNDVVADLAANSDVPYRATLAEAISEFPDEFYFKSDDKDAVGAHPGVLWIYKRTASSPFYSPMVAGSVEPGDSGSPVFVDPVEPVTDSAAIWFKTTPGSPVATLWIKEAN